MQNLFLVEWIVKPNILDILRCNHYLHLVHRDFKRNSSMNLAN